MDSINLRRSPGDAASASARWSVRRGLSGGLNADGFDAALEGQLRLLLAGGGDERIWPDAQTGRNKYGVPVAPAETEIWFSSSTASAVTPLAYQAAARMLARLISERRDRLRVEDWFEQLRSRLLNLFAIPGTAAILTASGTETELVALAVARSVLGRPLMNIVIAPGETGSGVAAAAAGQHFLASTALGRSVRAGSCLAGWEDNAIVVDTVEIRERSGAARPAADVDCEVAAKVARALHQGMDVLVHVLDTSKTGLSGLSRDAAAALAQSAGGRVLVAVDACQLRCSAGQIRTDLNSGHMVLLTGSKFAGGPAFSGALLLPPQLKVRPLALPAGLTAYSAYLDWPADLRQSVSLQFNSLANLGMGLRWEAALYEIETLAGIDAAVQDEIIELFAKKVMERVAATDWLRPLDRDGRPRQTILPVVLAKPTTLARAQLIHRALRSPDAIPGVEKICHLGQPVAVGDRAALRFCASAPMIGNVAQRLASGPYDAWGTVERDLDYVFGKLHALDQAER
jgi:hypothetical protein